MLKYVLAFFAFIVVSLAPVHADEGYIPFFPDFLEPDGIGFRGPAEITANSCWVNINTCRNRDDTENINAHGTNTFRASPITLEYRKNYFLKKLLYTESFFDFGVVEADGSLKDSVKDSVEHNYLGNSDIGSHPFLDWFLSSEEKSKISSLSSDSRFNLKTNQKFILFGTGIGLDLWILQIFQGFYLMYNDIKVHLRACKADPNRYSGGFNGSSAFYPKVCDYSPKDSISMDEQSYSGLSVGTRSNISLVILESDNWKISIFDVSIQSNDISWDSNFKPVKFRGLNYSNEFINRSNLTCNGYTKTDSSYNRTKVNNCTNPKGEDMSSSVDWTGSVKITYYFR